MGGVCLTHFRVGNTRRSEGKKEESGFVFRERNGKWGVAFKMGEWGGLNGFDPSKPDTEGFVLEEGARQRHDWNWNWNCSSRNCSSARFRFWFRDVLN